MTSSVRVRVVIFDCVRELLDSAWNDIPGDESARHSAVKKACASLTNQQRNVLNGPSVDYSTPEARYAHMLLHTAPHACWVSTLISSPRSKDIFLHLHKKNICTIWIFGGGPGSELLGVLKEWQLFSPLPQICCVVFDSEPGWSRYGPVITQTVSHIKNLTLQHKKCDFSDYNFILSALHNGGPDLIIMSYFASELHRERERTVPQLNRLLRDAPPGCCLLYIDIDHNLVCPWVSELVRTAGFSILSDRAKFALPPDEHRNGLGIHFKRFKLKYPDDPLFYIVGSKSPLNGMDQQSGAPSLAETK